MRSKIAVCQLNERVAPRFDQSPELMLVTIDDYGTVKEKKVLPTAALKPKEVVALLGRLQVTTLICGGVKEDSQQALKRVKIQFIDNVIGDVEDVLIRYIQGKLKRGNTKGLHG
jgi:predicted Fe-Mo cluster-binding NifX family protein